LFVYIMHGKHYLGEGDRRGKSGFYCSSITIFLINEFSYYWYLKNRVSFGVKKCISISCDEVCMFKIRKTLIKRKSINQTRKMKTLFLIM